MLKETSEGIILPVKIIPKAHKNEIVGWENEELKIKVRAIPEKGEANAELIYLISKHLGVSKSQVEIVAGQTSRHKRLIIKGIKISELLLRINDKKGTTGT